MGRTGSVPSCVCHAYSLCRHHMPYLPDCDPLTGEVIRASKTISKRYEPPAPDDLIHIDLKRVERIPPKGGWKAQGRGEHPATRAAWATTSCTQRSITTPGWPTPRS